MDAIQLLINRLPKKPYSTDDLSTGLRIRPLATALTKKYIQHNHPAWFTSFVFDVDRNAYEILDQVRAKPNLAVFNATQRDRAHFIYLLDQPINTGPNGRRSPIRYAESIDNAFVNLLNADPSYAGLITRNPLHHANLTYNIHNTPYSLDYLADFVDLSKTKQQREISAYGRNCRLFDMVRYHAYEIVEQYRKANAFEMFARTLMAFAEDKNQFKGLPALNHSEVKAIAKSVSKWTWNNYTGDKINRGRDTAINSLLSTQEKQTLSAIKTNEQRQQSTQEKILKAVRQLQAQGKKTTQKAVALQAGLTDRTVREYKHLLK